MPKITLSVKNRKTGIKMIRHRLHNEVYQKMRYELEEKGQ